MKVVNTPQGKVVVDKSDDIKKVTEGYYYDFYDKAHPKITYYYESDEIQKTDVKIIATIDWSLDKDVPMVVEVERLAGEYFNNEYAWIKGRIEPYSSLDIKSIKRDFIKGYKASQQKGVYSEEDLCNLVQQLKNYTKESLSILGHDEREPEEFVDIFLKSNQEYIELETEVIFCHGNGMLDYAIKTDLINGQLIAFKKKQLTIQND